MRCAARVFRRISYFNRASLVEVGMADRKEGRKVHMCACHQSAVLQLHCSQLKSMPLLPCCRTNIMPVLHCMPCTLTKANNVAVAWCTTESDAQRLRRPNAIVCELGSACARANGVKSTCLDMYKENTFLLRVCKNLNRQNIENWRKHHTRHDARF